MRWLESTFADKARAWVGFNEPVSHRITAAADVILMPSRFEPCGLNQLYAMRYAAAAAARHPQSRLLPPPASSSFIRRRHSLVPAPTIQACL